MQSLKLSKKILIIAGIYLFLSVCASFYAAWDMQQRNERRINQALNEIASRVTGDIQDIINRYQYSLRGARGVILATGADINREVYSTYAVSRDIDVEFPGLRGFGYIRRVPLADESAFLARARQDFPDFKIKQFEQNAGERYIVQFFEPLAGNEEALGVDLASYARYSVLAREVLREGEFRLSFPYPLSSQPKNYSYDLILPVYKHGVTPLTITDREQLGLGWVFAKLDISKAVPLAGPLQDNQVALVLTDITEPASPFTVFRTIKNYQARNMPKVVAEREMFGRQWQYQFIASERLIGFMNLTSWKTVLLIGLLTTLVIFLALLGFAYSRYLRKVSEDQRNFTKAIISSSPDAIVTCNRDGVISSWNQGAEKLFRYSEEEAIGMPLLKLIVPPDLQEEEINLQQRLRSGEYVPNFNTRRICKHGHPVDVSVSVTPVMDDNQLEGYSTTLRDITDEVMAQRQIAEINKNLETLVAQRTREVEEARQTLQGILDSIPLRVAYWSTDKHLIMANQDNLKSFSSNQPGLNIRQAVGKPMHKLLTGSGYQIASRLLDESINTGRKYSEEVQIQKPDGELLDLLVHVVPAIKNAEIVGFYTVSHDVSELRRNRRQIEALSRENSILLNVINKQFYYTVTSVEGFLLEINQQFCSALGYSREELLGKDARMLKSEEHSAVAYREVAAATSAGKTWRGELAHCCKDGSIRWFDTVAAPFMNEEGDVERLVAIRIDVTEQRNARQEIKRVNHFLSSVLNAASEVAIIGGDSEGVITLFNSGAENMLGYRAEEVVGEYSPAIFHDSDEVIARGKQLSEYFGEDINGFDIFVFLPRLKGSEVRQWTYIRKDGSRLQVSLAVTAMRDEGGNITGYLGVAVDITAEQQNRRRLETMRDQLTIAADVAELGVWTWKKEDDLLEWNARMFEMYAVSAEEKAGALDYQYWSQKVHPDDRAEVEKKFASALSGTGNFNPVFRIVLPDGEVRFIQAEAQVERDSQGNAIQVTGINRDITQQLNLERELRRAKELSDSANAAKSSFLANMSHEIRTPINAILGMLKLVGSTALNSRQRDYIVKADTAARTLLDLLNDILDFSKIEAGRLHLEMSDFDLDQLMREIGVVLDGYHKNDAVELNFDIDPGLPQFVLGDSLRLKQILLNLVSNALKFTEQGLVIVKLEQIQRSDKQVVIGVSVSDTGIGISPARQQEIFKDFTQAESSTSRRYGGTGLGLVICKRLTEMMGSELHVDSQLNKGSRFWFELALDIVADQGQNAVQPSKIQQGLHILLVEDNLLVAEIHTRMLMTMGHRIKTVHSASAAIGSVQVAKQKDEEPYDLILLDWMLPDMKGDEAAALIAKSYGATMPGIILLTAHSNAIADAGLPERVPHCAALISKPVTPKQLQEVIRGVMNDEVIGSASVESDSVIKAPLRDLRLLVVEDNDMNRQVAQELLMAEGADVELAINGRDGVAKVLADPARYNLVIMDMQMPEIDGLEATRLIREEPDCASLPILAMTANVSAADREQCLAAGMNDHLGKPIDMTKLLPKILKMTGRASVLTTLEKDTPVSPQEWYERVQARFAGNSKMFLRVQPKFYPTIDQLLKQLQLAILQDSRQLAVEALHAIKGTAATMAAVDLANLAAELEQQLKQLSDSDKGLGPVTEPDVQQLRNLFEVSAAALRSLAEQMSADVDEQAVVSISDEDLKTALTELLTLLESDNMRAIQVIETLQQKSSGIQVPWFDALADQVNALQFSEATITLKKVLQEME